MKTLTNKFVHIFVFVFMITMMTSSALASNNQENDDERKLQIMREWAKKQYYGLDFEVTYNGYNFTFSLPDSSEMFLEVGGDFLAVVNNNPDEAAKELRKIFDHLRYYDEDGVFASMHYMSDGEVIRIAYLNKVHLLMSPDWVNSSDSSVRLFHYFCGINVPIPLPALGKRGHSHLYYIQLYTSIYGLVYGVQNISGIDVGVFHVAGEHRVLLVSQGHQLSVYYDPFTKDFEVNGGRLEKISEDRREITVLNQGTGERSILQLISPDDPENSGCEGFTEISLKESDSSKEKI